MSLRVPAVLAVLILSAPLALAQSAPEAPAEPQAPVSAEAPALAVPQTGAAPAAPVAPAQPAGGDAAAAAEGAETPVDAPAAADLPQTVPLSQQKELMEMAEQTSSAAMNFLRDGGPSIWAIAALSVIALALILWKIWRLALIGAWSRGKAGKAVTAYERGEFDAALATVQGRMGIRSKVVTAALTAKRDMSEERAREETARVAKLHLGNASTGLGALELIATIAPLLGLLGTVLGMIAAFQALQEAGSKADPALLAGGIWEALLTTAAGMAVAIPASAALTWFEAVINRIRRDIEDSATRIFVAEEPQQLELAAE
jgi:biopolymer transport protein ExbB